MLTLAFMGVELVADPDAMRASVRSLDAALEGIASELSGLTALLNFLADEWSGEAAQAYANAQNQWNDGMEALRLTLAEAVRALQACATLYEDTERSVVSACT